MVGNFRRRIGAFALLLTTAWAPLAGCDSGGCQLHSDCNADQQCVQGRCEEACSDDFDCVLGEACVSGACVDAADAVRPRPCDPATSEAGCPDTSSPPDAVVDATPRDAAPVDAVVVDATAIDAGDAGDAASSDGGVETDGGPDTDAVGPDSSVTPSDIDLTGTYAVTRTVDLTNDDAFTEGDVAHFIANLTRLADHTRYRLDFIDPEGHALSSEVALDFRSPEGPYNYQYRYERPDRRAAAGLYGLRGDLRARRGGHGRAGDDARRPADPSRPVRGRPVRRGGPLDELHHSVGPHPDAHARRRCGSG
jgi:hypothetical protein